MMEEKNGEVKKPNDAAGVLEMEGLVSRVLEVE
jgi:hypothetical protein